MRTPICEKLGCEVPIFGFSHCRDVVVEISRAGGCGVLGAHLFSREGLEAELRWIDDHVGDKPYGVDVLIPGRYVRDAEVSEGPLRELVPPAHLRFVEDLLDGAGIPPLPEDVARQVAQDRRQTERNNTPSGAMKLLEVAMRHPKARLIVSALGTPPPELVERCHALGKLVGALCGKPEHAARHRDANLDLVIAQGTEAAGHTGQISTLVLLPQVIDAVQGKLSVLAAGGISRGSQIAGMIAMGAEGVWCGTLWLGTRESDLLPFQKEVLFRSRAEDAVQSLSRTGKPVRLLRSRWSEAWEREDAPRPLQPPLQEVLVRMAVPRIDRAGRDDFYTTPCGQAVGDVNEERTVRSVMVDLQNDYLEAMERLSSQWQRYTV
ncbi:nitronate monooxygenase family protein [Ramlibacter sp. AN1015]|uniref:nitronate monooxygenase n=1 Tax=Ramlibacter sp. AN1015 TaxID=3133428 RepID=UPI0030BD82C1